MRANYSTRRTSVVFNPRGGVFNGLGEGEGEGETGGGANVPGTGGNIPGGGYDVGAAADADAIAAQIALEASSKQAYEALVAAKEQSDKSNKNVRDLVSMVPVVGTVVRAFEFVRDFLANEVTARAQPGYAARQAEASKAMAEAQALAAGAGGDTRVLAEVTKVQNSLATLTAANKASIEAAVILLYQTYAKRNPDPASLAYWSNAFGPTVTADEVLAFQEALYRNEPNLRPVVTQTAAQPTNNLALPIIAAVAGFLLFGT